MGSGDHEREMGMMVSDIHHIKESLDAFVKGFQDKLDKIEENFGTEIKKNSEFRQRAKGVIGLLAFSCTILGSGIYWLFEKVLHHK